MKTRTRIAALAAVAALFAVAIAFAIYLVTEPGGVRDGTGGGAASADPGAVATAATASTDAALPVLPGPASTPSPQWRRTHPTVPVPVPNATPPIAGPPPQGLPADPAAREDAILDVRRSRYADQLERLNRRNVERGGVPSDAGARPPPAQRRPGDRRATLSAEP